MKAGNSAESLSATGLELILTEYGLGGVRNSLGIFENRKIQQHHKSAIFASQTMKVRKKYIRVFEGND